MTEVSVIEVGDKVLVEFVVAQVGSNKELELHRQDHCHPTTLIRHLMWPSSGGTYPTIKSVIKPPLPPHKAGDTFSVAGSGPYKILYIDKDCILYKTPMGAVYSSLKRNLPFSFNHIRWPD